MESSGDWIANKRPIVAVGVLIYDLAGQILLARMPKWRDQWAVVGGRVEYGESLIECAIREVFEETGLEISNLQFLQVQECIFSDEFIEPCHFIFINYTAVSSDNLIRPNEELAECIWVTISEALTMQLNSSTRKLILCFAESPEHQDGI